MLDALMLRESVELNGLNTLLGSRSVNGLSSGVDKRWWRPLTY